MEGLFGGTSGTPISQGQEDAFGLGTGSQQVQQTVQLGEHHVTAQEPMIPGQQQIPTQQAQISNQHLQQIPGQQSQMSGQLPQQPLTQQVHTQQPVPQVQIPQTREQILSDMMRIGQQIGKRVDIEKVNSLSDYDLQQQYFEVLKEVQQPAEPEEPQQQTSSELERLQKQNEEMGKLLAQLMGTNQQQPFPQYP